MRRADTERLLEQFRAYLREHGHSVTAQRETVLAAIARIGPHFDVEELALSLRAGRHPVSRATVYRTVKHLEAAGLVRKLDLDEPHAHYESTVGASHHEHLVCTRCGRIVEVTDRTLERRIEALARAHGFALERHAVQLMGTCRECRS